MSLRRRMGRNIKYVASGNIVAVIVSFFLLPFIIKSVGKEMYGIYILTLTLTGYFQLLDFGMMSAVTKYVAEYIGSGDKKGITEVSSLTFSMFTLIGAITAGILLVLSYTVTNIFKLEPANYYILRQLLWIAAFFALFNWPLNIFRSTISAAQKYNLIAMINISFQIIRAVLLVSLLLNGYGIITLMLVTQSLNLIQGITYYFMSKMCIEGFKIYFPYFNQRVFSNVFSFSFYVFMRGISGMMGKKVDILLISIFLPISYVSVYAVAQTIQYHLSKLPPIFVTPAWPLCAELQGKREYDKQRILLLKGTKHILAIFVPITIIIMFYARPFILNWMGSGFEESIAVVWIFSIYIMIASVISLASSLLTAKGIVKEPFWLVFSSSLLNLFLSLVLVQFFGIYGIALGTALSVIFVKVMGLIWITCKYFDLKLSEFLSKVVLTNIPIFFITAIMGSFGISYFYPHNLFNTLAQMAFIYCAVMLFNFILSNRSQKHELIDMLGIKNKKLLDYVSS